MKARQNRKNIIKIKNAIKIKNSAPNDRGILNLSILSVIGSKKYANKKPIIKKTIKVINNFKTILFVLISSH